MTTNPDTLDQYDVVHDYLLTHPATTQSWLHHPAATGAFRTRMAQLVDWGLVEHVDDPLGDYYRLTESGSERVAELTD